MPCIGLKITELVLCSLEGGAMENGVTNPNLLSIFIVILDEEQIIGNLYKIVSAGVLEYSLTSLREFCTES